MCLVSKTQQVKLDLVISIMSFLSTIGSNRSVCATLAAAEEIRRLFRLYTVGDNKH